MSTVPNRTWQQKQQLYGLDRLSPNRQRIITRNIYITALHNIRWQWRHHNIINIFAFFCYTATSDGSMYRISDLIIFKSYTNYMTENTIALAYTNIFWRIKRLKSGREYPRLDVSQAVVTEHVVSANSRWRLVGYMPRPTAASSGSHPGRGVCRLGWCLAAVAACVDVSSCRRRWFQSFLPCWRSN